jgi:hypothetical protein
MQPERGGMTNDPSVRLLPLPELRGRDARGAQGHVAMGRDDKPGRDTHPWVPCHSRPGKPAFRRRRRLATVPTLRANREHGFNS